MAIFTVTPNRPRSERLDDASNHRHRRIIGTIGLALPILLILTVVWRDGLTVVRELDSISAYYYSGANPLFVGMLFVLAMFLLAYEGYENKYQKWDVLCARIAAAAALCVAFFPTAAPNLPGMAQPPWWTPYDGKIHFAGAFVLFGMFAVFCIVLFRLTEKSAAYPADKVRVPDPDPGKRWRNRFYLLCGVVIVVCIIWAFLNGLRGRPIFWQECIALVFFALSWLVKGEWLRSLPAVARRSLAPGEVDDGAPDRR